MTRSQKIILLSVGVALIAILIALYFIGRKPAEVISQIDTTKPTLYLPGDSTYGQLSSITNKEGVTVKQVLENPIVSYWIDESDLTLYSVNASGVVVSTPHNGSSEIVSTGDGRPLVSALPRPMGDMVILTTGDRVTPFISVLNVITGKRSFLPSTARSANWHPNGKDILYLRDGDARNKPGIYLLSTQKNTAVLLSSFKLADATLIPYSKNSVLLVEPPTREVASNAWLFDLNKNTLTAFGEPAEGLMYSWNITNDSGLRFTSKGGMSLINKSGTYSLEGNITLPSKCILSSSKTYCGVPNRELTLLPDSYLQKSSYSVDSIYSFGTQGEARLILDGPALGAEVDITELKKVGDVFYFINRYNNRLYSIEGVLE